jgi:hypothetical protein
MPAALWLKQPVKALVTFHDGAVEEWPFPSRAAAEEYTYLIPWLQLEGDEVAGRIARWVLRPLGMGIN